MGLVLLIIAAVGIVCMAYGISLCSKFEYSLIIGPTCLISAAVLVLLELFDVVILP